jgi:hypothetical protein
MPDGDPLRIGVVNKGTSPTSLQRGDPPFTTFNVPVTTEGLVVQNSNGGFGLRVESSRSGVAVLSENGLGVDVINRRGTAVAATTEDRNPDAHALVASAGGGSAIRAHGSCEFFGNTMVMGDLIISEPQNGQTTIRLDATQGDIRLSSADCAEDFDVSGAEEIEPGTVMVIDHGGGLKASEQAYDKRVAGVISGADGYRPGIILDQRESRADRMPMALIGKVYCKVDARYSPIEVGDLLTTSSTPGHAMKAIDPLKAFGAVLGKALHGLGGGQGLVPILVSLQ